MRNKDLCKELEIYNLNYKSIEYRTNWLHKKEREQAAQTSVVLQPNKKGN